MEKDVKFYRELVDGLAEGVFRVSVPSGKFEYVNASLRKVYGYGNKLPLHDLSILRKVIHPDFLKSVVSRWAGICLKGKVTYPTHEYKIRTEKGEVRWIAQTTREVLNEKKKLIAIEGTCRDITEEKVLKESVLDSHQEFQELFDNMQDGIMVFDVKNGKEFYIKDFNDKAVKLSKFRKKDIGMEMRERFPGAVASGYIDLLEKTYKTKEPQSFSDMEYLSPEGATLYREGYVYCLKNGSVVLIYDDITERVMLQQKLREEEEQFHELFNKMPSAVAVCEARNHGTEFYFKNLNKKALELDKINPKKVLGTEVREYFPGVEKMGLLAAFKKTYSTGKPQYLPCQKFVAQNGDVSYREDSLYKLPNGDIVTIYNDITKRIALEEELKDREEQFRELFRSMKSAVAVFEVRNNGTEFYFKDINKKAEEIEKHSRKELVGTELRKYFPGVEKMGFVSWVQQVYKTGKPQDFLRGEYVNKKGETSYRDNYIYKLPNGDVVAVYDDTTQQVRAEMELKEKIKESAKLNEFMVGRELKMVELKEQIKQLEGMVKKQPK